MGGNLPRLIVGSLIIGLLTSACGGGSPAPQPESKPAQPASASTPQAKPAAPATGAAPAAGASPVAGASPAAGSGAPAAQKPATVAKVKIGYTPIFEFMTLYAAKELGYFDAEGVDVELVQFRGGGEITTAMLGRSIEIQATTIDRALILAEKGQRTKNIVQNIHRVTQTLIVKNDVNVAYGDLKALRGKKMGMTTAGSGTDLFMRYYFKTAGLDPDKDISIISVGPPATMISALQSGAVDGVNAIEPATTQAVEQMKIAKAVLDVAKDGPGLFKTMPFLGLGATAEWVDSNGDTVKRLVRAQVKANNDLRGNPARAVQVARKYFENVDAALAESILKKQSQYWVSEITEEEMKTAAQVNKELGLLTKDIPFAEVTAGKEIQDLWK